MLCMAASPGNQELEVYVMGELEPRLLCAQQQDCERNSTFVFEFLHSESDFFERSKLKVWLAQN